MSIDQSDCLPGLAPRLPLRERLVCSRFIICPWHTSVSFHAGFVLQGCPAVQAAGAALLCVLSAVLCSEAYRSACCSWPALHGRGSLRGALAGRLSCGRPACLQGGLQSNEQVWQGILCDSCFWMVAVY